MAGASSVPKGSNINLESKPGSWTAVLLPLRYLVVAAKNCCLTEGGAELMGELDDDCLGLKVESLK